MYKIGVIGFGNMGRAILKGAVSNGLIEAKDCLVYGGTRAEKQAEIAKLGFKLANDEAEVYTNCEIILLATVPSVYDEILTKLKTFTPPTNQIILTIAAPITSNYIRSFLNDAKVVKIMPNTPLLIGLGSTVLSKTSNVTDAEFQTIVNIFEKMGVVETMDEELLMEIVPANGSAPALVYYFIQSIADAVAKRGVPHDVALNLVAKTFIGSAEMVLQTGETPQALIDEVCTPGGLTHAAINSFKENNVAQLIEQACAKCVERGYELKK